MLESYNKLHVQPGVLTPDFEQFGVVLLGNWRGIPQFVSEEQYEHTDGSMKYFVPEKEVLVAATGIQSVMAYAGVAQASDGGMDVYEGRRIPLVYWTPPARTIAACDCLPGRFQFLATPIPGPFCKCCLNQLKS